MALDVKKRDLPHSQSQHFIKAFHSVLVMMLDVIAEYGCEKELVAPLELDSPRQRLPGVRC